MAIYVVTVSSKEGGWVENTNTYYASHGVVEEGKERKGNLYPTKMKAYESVKLRFSDFDFESDKVIFNGNEAHSMLDLVKIIGSESIN